MTLTVEQRIENFNIIKSDISKDYWGVYLNDEKITITSTKEQAEKTKEWMENWLNTKN